VVVRAIKTGQAQEIKKTTPDGRSWFNIGCPVRDEKNTIVGGIEVVLEITERKKAEEALRESEGKLNAMLQSIGDHMSMMDKDLNIIWTNKTAKEIFGNDVIGKKCYETYHQRKDPCEPYPCITLKAFQDGKIHEHDTQVIDKDGKKIFFHCTANVALKDKEGKPTAVLEISRDTTEHKQAELVLIERGKELENKTHELEEVNAALRVLLKHRDEDKKDLEDKVVANVKELVFPYVEKLNNSRLNDRQMVYLNIIKSNLEDIITPFLHQLSSKYSVLTPNEIQVAGFVKEGKTTKEIAELLNSSTGTIDFHRNNLRKKLGLRNTKTNLRSFLLHLT
jgi:PAS domain S-box-containing protein